MKVLVIGASGMLAKPVVKHFDQKGFQIRLFSRSVNKTMYEKEYEIVNGDIFNKTDLENAMDSCDAIHISIGKTDEGKAVETVIKTAKNKQIKLISYVSGASVKKENTWFPMTKGKYIAEQSIINSGIPYIIFRPTWFMESLGLMVRDGKAMIIGKQPIPSHWLAGEDFGRMIVAAYQKNEAQNKIFYCYGPEKYLMKSALEKYITELYPEIKKISSIPIGMMKLIAFLTGKKELKIVASMFAYFEKTGESESNEETDKILGNPEITLDKWIKTQKV